MSSEFPWEAVYEKGYDAGGTPIIRIHPSSYRNAIRALKDDGFFFISLSVIHWKKLFEVLVYLYSLEKGGLLVSTIVPENEEIDSIVDLFPGAYLYEAEAYELLGVRFRGNPGLKRHFTPEEIGHPLRKEYELQETPIGGWE